MDVTQQGHCSLLAIHLGPNCRDLPPIYGYLNIFDKDFCRLTTSCIFFSKSKGGTWAFEAWDLEVTHFQTNPADADDHISQRGGIWMDMDGYGHESKPTIVIVYPIWGDVPWCTPIYYLFWMIFDQKKGIRQLAKSGNRRKVFRSRPPSRIICRRQPVLWRKWRCSWKTPRWSHCLTAWNGWETSKAVEMWRWIGKVVVSPQCAQLSSYLKLLPKRRDPSKWPGFAAYILFR